MSVSALASASSEALSQSPNIELQQSYHPGSCTQQAHKLTNVIPQHIVVPHILHLLICCILRYKQISPREPGGDLSHSLCNLAKVLKQTSQLLHLDRGCKHNSKPHHKIVPCHDRHSHRSQTMTNLIPPIMSSVP